MKKELQVISVHLGKCDSIFTQNKTLCMPCYTELSRAAKRDRNKCKKSMLESSALFCFCSFQFL